MQTVFIFDEGQITHLICARLKYDLYDFFRGCFGPFLQEKEQEAGPKHPLKKSYRSYFRRAQIRWVIWPSSIFGWVVFWVGRLPLIFGFFYYQIPYNPASNPVKVRLKSGRNPLKSYVYQACPATAEKAKSGQIRPTPIACDPISSKTPTSLDWGI